MSTLPELHVTSPQGDLWEHIYKRDKRIADLEAERAHIIRQYDENLDCGLRISTKLEEAEKRIKELEAAAVPLCVGQPLISIIAKEGQWVSRDGRGLVAASDLFGKDPYARIAKLEAALHLASLERDMIQRTLQATECDLGKKIAELEANQTFAGWRDAVLREREHVARVEGERNHLYSALEDIANMPHYDQDDAHRLRHKAANAIKQPHTSPMTAAPAHSDIVWPMHERPSKPAQP